MAFHLPIGVTASRDGRFARTTIPVSIEAWEKQKRYVAGGRPAATLLWRGRLTSDTLAQPHSKQLFLPNPTVSSPFIQHRISVFLPVSKDLPPQTLAYIINRTWPYEPFRLSLAHHLTSYLGSDRITSPLRAVVDKYLTSPYDGRLSETIRRR